MPRPRKWRRVCCLPESERFGPIDNQKLNETEVVMTVEEYEAIRLIDLEGLNQEACGEQMNIARTTVQKIYSDARQKIADALINSKVLLIEGGDYRVCEGGGKSCHKKGCCRSKEREVTYNENSNTSQ